MTKTQEIQALKTFADNMPAEGYLRAWLQDVLPQVEMEIRSDFPVSPSIFVTRRDCEAMVQAAKEQAAAIRDATKQEADQMLAKTRRECSNIRSACADKLNQAMKQVNDLI